MTKFTLTVVVLLGMIASAQERTVWDGVYTQAQAARGAQVYAGRCASCHGDDLAGRNVDAQRRPRKSPPLIGEAFLMDWNGLPLEALFTRDRISMPQEAPGSLSAAQNADLLAYLLQKNGFPVGTTELPSNGSLLKGIAFVAAKP